MRRFLACATAVILIAGCTPEPRKTGEPQWHDPDGVLTGKMVECKLVGSPVIGAISARVENLSNNKVRVRGEIDITLTPDKGSKVEQDHKFEFNMEPRKAQVAAKVIPPATTGRWRSVSCKLDNLEYRLP